MSHEYHTDRRCYTPKKCASLEAEILMCVLLHISILIFKQKNVYCSSYSAIISVHIVQVDRGIYLCVGKKYTQPMCIIRHHTLEAMHFGIVELWSMLFSSDSNKASASISPASEASATCFFQKKKKYITGSFVD
jgi:hypothetical protein